MTAVTALEKHITVNGIQLRYLDWGTKGNLPMVCLHGHTGQAHIWDQFAEAMAPHYHVLAVDQRGHGESEWAETGYERDRFVEDLAEFVDTLGFQQFVLVGLSMGGWHSLLYTPNHQERVKRIVIVDIAPEPGPNYVKLRDSLPLTPIEFPSLSAVVDWMRKGNPWASDAALRKDAQDKMRESRDGSWRWKADPKLHSTRLRDLDDPEMIQRYWDSFTAITCPILEVRGTESILVSDPTIARMKREGHQFTSIDIEGAGHVVAVDKPLEFIESTRSFLDVPV